MLERYSYVNGKKLRCGYTTGTCATAAAMGAARILLSGKKIDKVWINLNEEITFELKLEDINISENSVRCAVRKDSGDDIDATNGILVYSTVSFNEAKEIVIDGGTGVGRVTKLGLDQPVGAAAINSTPRRKIKEALTAVCDEYRYDKGLRCIIDVPEGLELAKKTFNPRLGIEGGISILGTTGIVEPMSEQALLDTIKLEINMKQAKGIKNLLVTPGNYGLEYVKGNTVFDEKKAVKCSNFIGETIDLAVENGFENMLLIGHIGKLIKVSLGIMNTHSRNADGRMEALLAAAVKAEVDSSVYPKILDCNTTDEAIEIFMEHNCLEKVMKVMTEKIDYYLKKRAGDTMNIAGIIFSSRHGLLGMTEGVEKMLGMGDDNKW